MENGFDKLLSEAKEKGLPEDFLVEAKKLFDALIDEKENELNEKYEERLMEEKAKFITEYEANAEKERADFVASILEEAETYATKTVRDFIAEKAEEIESAMKYKAAAEALDSIVEAIKKYGIEVNIDTDEEFQKMNFALAEAESKIEKLEKKIVEYETKIENIEKEKIFEELTEDLSDSQKEKVKLLVGESAFSFPTHEFAKVVFKAVSVIGEEAKEENSNVETLEEFARKTASVIIEENVETVENDDAEEINEEKNHENLNNDVDEFERAVMVAAKLLGK